MNAVVSLSHFCETHGPTILLSTQAFHFVGGFRGGNLESTGSQFFGYIERFKDTIEGTTPNVSNVTCEACESISGYITNDYQNKISFLSTRLATDSNVSYLLKQAAVRSLSCEVIPKKEGKVYFGDSIRGHVLSTTFFVKDAQARGFHRWYSIIVFMKDKHFLLNSWPFFQEHINQIIAKLQNKAAEVYSNEQIVCSQRALRLSFSDQKHSVARSLMKLTSSTNIFAELHLWFTWLLSMGGRRLEELIPTQLLESKKQLQSVEGATLQQEIENKKMFNEEAVSHLRRLRRILGAHNFQRFLYSALIGRQVIVRGSKHIVQNIINLLKLFLPAEKFRCQEFSKIYKTPEVCNIIGLDLCAAVPVASNSIMRLDIVSPQEIEGATSSNSNFLYENCHFLVKNDGELPEKLPTFLLKLDRDLSEESLTDRVVWLNILSLKEKWFHLAEIIRAAKKYQKQLQLMSLLRLLGVQEQDEKLVEFWTS